MTQAHPDGAALPQTRLPSIDALRGLVMIIMALDHARDFFSNATFDPTDLAHTSPALFLTRWITHVCAPVFVLLAGVSARLSARGGKSTRDLAGFLARRGLWLIVLEILVVTPLGWSFNWDFSFVRMQVIWVIGAAMLLLAAQVLVLSPRRIGLIGLAMVVGHNLLDGLAPARFGAFAPALHFLHAVTPMPFAPHTLFIFLYPIIPWAGVMAVGYGFGDLMQRAEPQRRRMALVIGVSMIALFCALRLGDVYGDPKPWSPQSTIVMTVLSVLNVTKYPPSLAYLLITLGPALLVLAIMDRAPRELIRPLQTFGRVPLFYYLIHLPLLHALAIAFSYARYGQAPWLFHDMMAQKGALHPLPPGYGYDLPVVYAVWAAAVLALYPACRGFARLKARHPHPLLRYL